MLVGVARVDHQVIHYSGRSLRVASPSITTVSYSSEASLLVWPLTPCIHPFMHIYHLLKKFSPPFSRWCTTGTIVLN